MKVIFICRLHQIELTEKISGFDRIDDELSVTNDEAYIKKLLGNADISIIGKMEYEDITSGNLVAFSIDEVQDDASTKSFLVEKLYRLQSFILSIWLSFDNAINFELGFLFVTRSNGIIIESNLLACKFSNSKGAINRVEISRSKFAEIRKFYREMIQFDSTRSSTKISKNYDRIERALYMVSSARSENDLGLKIANYCTVLESLLSTSQNELAHQVAERLAFFIGKTPDNKIEIYRTAKKAYNIRSKVVHGDTISTSDIQNLEIISEFCDNAIRDIFKLLYSSKNLYEIVNNSKALDEFMIEIILGKRKIDDFA